MKLIRRCIEKDGKGSISLLAEEAEDIWHAYNLIIKGDVLKSTTLRKVITESSTGSTGSNKMRITLTISVEDVYFDTDSCILQVKGRNIKENQFVKIGAYHTLDLELNRQFTLTKSLWDTIAIERIETACDSTKRADLAAIIMHSGIAHICLITENMTLVRAKISMNIPKKQKRDCTQHIKGLNRFFEAVYQGVLKHINFEVVKCVLIASPGFLKEQFFNYMISEAARQEHKTLLENKHRFVLERSASGFVHALHDILADVSTASKLADTKAAEESRCLNRFCMLLMEEPAKAFYGPKHVLKANAAQAIDTLLISDNLFRCSDVSMRKLYVSLVNNVKDYGGEVKLFSSLHSSGEQLNQMTGIAAILRFPMEELEEEEM